jgi:hypothetical protein
LTDSRRSISGLAFRFWFPILLLAGHLVVNYKPHTRVLPLTETPAIQNKHTQATRSYSSCYTTQINKRYN